MEKKTITVDLTNARNEREIILCFVEVFGFDLNGGSWDAFYDDIRSLDTQSPVVFKDMPRAVHVILKNAYKVAEKSREDYRTFLEIMADATDKKQRSDGIEFTFEIANEYE